MSNMERVLWDALKNSVCTPGEKKPVWFKPCFEGMQEAHTHWSSLSIAWPAFCEHVAAAMVRTSAHQDAENWVQKGHFKDLYLAFACLEGSSTALQALRTQHMDLFRSVVHRFAKPPLTREELEQELWIHLFVTTETKAAKIGLYAGQGPLESWLRVTSVRACIDYTRMHPHLKKEKPLDKERLLALPDQVFDQEVAFLKHEYRAHFREAFASGIASLSSRERLLLRYHVVEGLSIDQIGALFQFHRSTAARHLQRARQQLLENTKKHLIQKLDISQKEFGSIMRLIQSKWEVSVQRLLGHVSSTEITEDTDTDV